MKFGGILGFCCRYCRIVCGSFLSSRPHITNVGASIARNRRHGGIGGAAAANTGFPAAKSATLQYSRPEMPVPSAV